MDAINYTIDDPQSVCVHAHIQLLNSQNLIIFVNIYEIRNPGLNNILITKAEFTKYEFLDTPLCMLHIQSCQLNFISLK